MIVRYNICFCKGSTSSSHPHSCNKDIFFANHQLNFGRRFDYEDDGDGNNRF